MNSIKKLLAMLRESLRMPSPEMMAMQELEQAKRELLQMQTAKDYSSRMVEYNQDRVRRLTAHLQKNIPTVNEAP